MIGQQPQAEDGKNYTDPAESYKTGDQAHFRTGLNELVFDIKIFWDPSGLDYRAVINFMASTPVSIDIKPGEYPNTALPQKSGLTVEHSQYRKRGSVGSALVNTIFPGLLTIYVRPDATALRY